MADRANDGSSRLGNWARSPVRSGAAYSGDRLNNPSGGLALAAIAAVATACVRDVGRGPGAVAMRAARAPAYPRSCARNPHSVRRAAGVHGLSDRQSRILGRREFRGAAGEHFVSHLAGAAVFALFVACATEATRRWSGLLAALVFPTFETAFYFTLGWQSPHGTWGSPAYSQVDFVHYCKRRRGSACAASCSSCRCCRRGWRWPGIGADGTWTGRSPAIMALGVFALAVMLGLDSRSILGSQRRRRCASRWLPARS